MPVIRLIFLWHMHQPYYKDLVSAEYRLPWVRLHALKDYYGMVKLLDEFPGVHQTFNLVPALMTQIQDYAQGSARDPLLEIIARPAADLKMEERQFALHYLFQANPQNLIGRYPRFQELWQGFQGLSGNAAQAAPLMKNNDLCDLQVLSQIAWFDEFWLADPDVRELIRKGRNFDRQDQQFVVRKQRELLAGILPAYSSAAERGMIEISTSPYYHPILPLICDSAMGAISHQGLSLPQRRYRHPGDAREQIMRALDLHQEVFGVRPRGMWPSEGSVSDETLAIAHSTGLRWTASDEGVLGRSIGKSFVRDGQGTLQGDGPGLLYRIYRWEQQSASMHVIFRDHSLSDLIGFVYCGAPPADAAADFLRRTRESCAPVLAAGADAVVPVILDGENAWEYYPQSGREFLRRLYAGIQSDPMFESLTVSEALEREPQPAVLGSIFPGSWINANFDVWIGAPEDNLSWDHLGAARDFYAAHADAAAPEQRALALEELLIAEGSDWNWWYGPEHHSANDREFDELYRKHLSNVYHALGAEPPAALAHSIASVQSRSRFAFQTGYISPRIASPAASYFDWLGAACYVAERRYTAMHGGIFLLDTAYAGIDASYLYCRLDFMANASEWAHPGVMLLVHIERRQKNLPEAEPPAFKLEVRMVGAAIESWLLDDGRTTTNKVEGLLTGLRKETSFQCRIPLLALSAGQGTVLHLRFSVWRDRLPLDALPREGAIELNVVPESELSALAYAKP